MASPNQDSTDPIARRILVVDDEQTIRDAVGRFLRARGFEVQVAETAAVALDHLRVSRFAALICDVRMPGISGIALLPEVRKLDPDVAVLMLTGLNDATTATEAFAHGAMDYLLKPIELDRLEQAVGLALRRRHEQIAQRGAAQVGRDDVALRMAALERENLALSGLTVTVLETIVTLFEAKDPYRAGHSQRVAELASTIARALRLDESTVGHVNLAARLHDIGKVSLPEPILLKPAPLSPDEYEGVRQHVRIGVQILSPIKQLAPVLPFVRDHHEKWDGSGYPAHLKGEAISIGGRILGATDAFVAVTSGRPYFTALPPADALAYLAHRIGADFDPDVFRALQQAVRARLG